MYTLSTENYSFDNITTDLTRCPAYSAMTCISFIALGGTFPFQIKAHTTTAKTHTRFKHDGSLALSFNAKSVACDKSF